jgi:hypothetical protein
LHIDISRAFVGASFAQENMTTATNETGAMMGNQTNQTEGNQTQQGPLEQLGEALGGVFGGGEKSITIVFFPFLL